MNSTNILFAELTVDKGDKVNSRVDAIRIILNKKTNKYMVRGENMKLAEALNLRADLQKRIADLKERLIKNAKVQEGDTPTENPKELLSELNDNILELESIIKSINKTNSSTYINNESISDLIAKRDVLGLKLSILRSFVNEAADKIERYSNKEIRILSTVNVAEKQKEIDNISKEYRLLDTKIQGLNWTTDIIH